MRVAVVVFDGFDESATFVTLDLLNRLAPLGWSARLAAPVAAVTSRNGVTVQVPQPLEAANEADAVVLAGGLYARAVAEDGALVDRLALDPTRQWIAGQCGGVLLMARLGLLADQAACADAATRPVLLAYGVRVEDSPFHAHGPVATAAGTGAAPYLAAWLMWQAAGLPAATEALRAAAPVGERDAAVQRVLQAVRPFVPAD